MHPFSAQLLTWYEQHGRDLPWRNIVDPYRIWISEIILQQTRVAQGYDYYLRFINRFPTVEDLAAASQDEVMRQWEGLGYYSRARNLHTAAQQIVALGNFPTDYAGVRALKGVGDYTAAAICSFAYNLPTAVVDGNVYRVLSRHFGIEIPIDSTLGKKHFSALAQELLPRQHSAAYNQAIMDFGAIQCTPKSPRCLLCPIAETCVALDTNKVDILPIKAKKTVITHRYFVYIIIQSKVHNTPHIYLHRRVAGDIWEGLYEPFLLEFPSSPSTAEVWQFLKKSQFVNPDSTLVPIAQNLKHQLTHRLLHADAYILKQPHNIPNNFVAIPETELSNYAYPKLVNLIWKRALPL